MYEHSKKKKKIVLTDTTARNLLLVVEDVVHCSFMCRAETLGPCRIYICGIEQVSFYFVVYRVLVTLSMLLPLAG